MPKKKTTKRKTKTKKKTKSKSMDKAMDKSMGTTKDKAKKMDDMMPAGEVTMPAEIEVYLTTLEFPADKDTVLEHARMQGASQDVLDMLEEIPEQEYSKMAEVVEEVEVL